MAAPHLHSPIRLRGTVFDQSSTDTTTRNQYAKNAIHVVVELTVSTAPTTHTVTGLLVLRVDNVSALCNNQQAFITRNKQDLTH
jgi:hypothetical protein